MKTKDNRREGDRRQMTLTVDKLVQMKMVR